MELAKEGRMARAATFRSKSDPGISYRAAILYGGTMERPKWECECPGFQFRKECRHVKELWEDMDGFLRANAVHHDEIYQKHGWS